MHQLVNLQNAKGYIIYFTADCIAGKSAVDLLIDIPIFYKEPCNLLNEASEETKFELADVFQRLFKKLGKQLIKHRLITASICKY